MPRGAKGKKKGEKAKAAPAKPVGVWVWAQCDNAGCQKWRKLPPGTVIDDKEPWFCYMNPNEDRNDCNIPEEEYDAATEAAVYSQPVSDDERDHSRGWTPSDEPAQRQQTHGFGQLNGRRHASSSDLEPAVTASGGRQLGSLHAGRFQEAREASPAARLSASPADAAEAGWIKEEPGSIRCAEGRDGGANSLQSLRGIRKARRAHHGFNKLLAIGGVWEVTKGKGKAVTAPPAWVWEGLATHAPDSARLACEAADASSAARYFEMIQAPRGSDQAQEAANTARLALTAAAALAVRETREIPGIDDSPASGGSSTFGGPDAAPGSADGQAEVESGRQQQRRAVHDPQENGPANSCQQPQWVRPQAVEMAEALGSQLGPASSGFFPPFGVSLPQPGQAPGQPLGSQPALSLPQLPFAVGKPPQQQGSLQGGWLNLAGFQGQATSHLGHPSQPKLWHPGAAPSPPLNGTLGALPQGAGHIGDLSQLPNQLPNLENSSMQS